MFLCALVIAGAVIGSFVLSQTPEPEGRVTNIFHDVQLLPAQADPRAAAINDKVDEGTALRTGGDSRSELTFADLTITRLGENTIYSFNRAGRSVRLDSGSILLYARKNSGSAEISTKAVSVGITGTTLIFESSPDSYDRLIVLEGDARFSLNNYRDQSTELHAGQLLNVRPGAKKLPKPGRVDLRRIIKTHPLIKNFPPLPSLDLILAAADGRNPNRPPPQPQSPISGTGSQGGPPPVYVPNPTGPPTGSGYPVNPVPTPTPRHRPSSKPYPTVKPTTPRPTTHRPGSTPTPTPKKRYPPIKRGTPTPGQIIRWGNGNLILNLL
jgi:FecR protein